MKTRHIHNISLWPFNEEDLGKAAGLDEGFYISMHRMSNGFFAEETTWSLSELECLWDFGDF
jgi:hypothetical protein